MTVRCHALLVGLLTAVVLTAGCTTAAEMTGKVTGQTRVRQALSTDKVYPAIGPYSQMISHNGTLYVSGVLPLNVAGNAIEGTTIEAQTRLVLTHIGAILRSQGLDYGDALMTTVYMKDLNDFAAMNKVYGEFFTTPAPARATIQVARIPRDALIEIAVIAGQR